jgi:hypothetical protein
VSSRILTPDDTHGRDLVIYLGQSNAANLRTDGDYTSWPLLEQSTQANVIEAAWIWGPSYYAPGTNWAHLQPHKVSDSPGGTLTGNLRGGTWLSLGNRLRQRGLNPAIASYLVQGTDSGQWVANMTTGWAWLTQVVAWAALLKNTRSVSVVVYQGENNAVSTPLCNQWATDWATVMAAVRAAFAAYTVRLVVVRLPASYVAQPYVPEVRGQQDTYVASDALSGLIEPTSPTYEDGTHLVPASQIVAAYQMADKLAQLLGK